MGRILRFKNVAFWSYVNAFRGVPWAACSTPVLLTCSEALSSDGADRDDDSTTRRSSSCEALLK